MKERLDDVNFQVNSDVDGKFGLILPDEDLIENLGVKYSSKVMHMDKEYDDMIVEGRPNDEYKVVDKYLGINLIFDVCTKDKHRGTVVKLSQVLDGRAIGHSRTNYFFETR